MKPTAMACLCRCRSNKLYDDYWRRPEGALGNVRGSSGAYSWLHGNGFLPSSKCGFQRASHWAFEGPRLAFQGDSRPSHCNCSSCRPSRHQRSAWGPCFSPEDNSIVILTIFLKSHRPLFPFLLQRHLCACPPSMIVLLRVRL